jgi:GNAT superfamily N-acetyltransferase
MARVIRRKAKKKPKTCKPITRWEVEEIVEDFAPKTRIVGYIAGRKGRMVTGDLQEMRTSRGTPVMMVTWSYAHHEFQRCGYGTQLYQKMRDIACERGAPLASDTSRKPKSEGFWQKQYRKGRARCLGPYATGGITLIPEDAICEQYIMKQTCPADRSLAAIARAKAHLKKRRR